MLCDILIILDGNKKNIKGKKNNKIKKSIGSILLALAIKNSEILKFLLSILTVIIFDIKYPLITKNISTPIKPPDNKIGSKWKIITDITAIALKPSIFFL